MTDRTKGILLITLSLFLILFWGVMWEVAKALLDGGKTWHVENEFLRYMYGSIFLALIIMAVNFYTKAIYKDIMFFIFPILIAHSGGMVLLFFAIYLWGKNLVQGKVYCVGWVPPRVGIVLYPTKDGVPYRVFNPPMREEGTGLRVYAVSLFKICSKLYNPKLLVRELID